MTLTHTHTHAHARGLVLFTAARRTYSSEQAVKRWVAGGEEIHGDEVIQQLD